MLRTPDQSSNAAEGFTVLQVMSKGGPIRRPPSKLNDIQPSHWLPEYTTELLNVLNVLSLLVQLEPAQADLLERICAGPLLSHEALIAANALAIPPKGEKLKKHARS